MAIGMDPLVAMMLTRQGLGKSSPMGQGLASARGGNLGMGAPAPSVPMPQMLSNDNGPRNGMNPMLMGSMFGGGGFATPDASGGWTPGPQGFPMSAGRGGK